jgi:hypothetical protein
MQIISCIVYQPLLKMQLELIQIVLFASVTVSNCRGHNSSEFLQKSKLIQMAAVAR